MFEGLVRQLLLGYLGQYIKDIQKEQLKITLWNEEVLLENVELILEAFDYLQLPIALQKGNVGKLSIRIPWKKLGWDPIIIILEDVEICAGQREDEEWTAETIEKRQFAGKKAKLAAAELAKLSRRVCDNQTGKSFISYITARILDGIQLTIRNVHVQYRHMSKAPAITLFGLKLSSLMITRQNPTGFSSVKLKGAQVNKLIEVHGLELYCTGDQSDHNLLMVNDDVHPRANSNGSEQNEDKMYMHILAPLDMTVFLSVNRSGKLENDAPQYSVNFELSRLDIFLDEIQLQQILTLYDYLSICQLREQYGCYRPWMSPLEKKLKGWQVAWWQYAQRSVLLDVRKRLRKTSFKYLGDQLNRRRKYVNLYKIKLKCLREDKMIDDDVLRELEEMEKEAEVDDILIYRSAAEHELEDYLENSSPGIGSNSSSSDKFLEDGRLSGKPRGWLNWLSRGMLGASGTDDSGHFSGVISDDVIQDIYEATKFHPTLSSNDDAAANVTIYLSLVKVTIREICATLRSIKLGYAIAELVVEDISIDCKVREESALVIASVNSARLLNPLDEEAILFARRDEPKVEQAFVSIQVDVLSPNSDISSSVKVGIQPIEVLCNFKFMKHLSDFFHILEHLSFQHERILSSLNGIEDTKARLLSKTEYAVSSRKRMILDVRCCSILIVAPWENAYSELHKAILEAGEIHYSSKIKVDSMYSDMQNNSYPWQELTSDDLFSFQNQDLYDNFEISISNFEVKLIIPQSNGPLSLIGKSTASLSFISCIISDEPSLKALDVNMKVSPLLFYFSPSIYEEIMGLVKNSNGLHCMLDSAASGNRPASGNTHSNRQISGRGFWFSVAANLESVSLEVDLESGKDSYTLVISLQMLDLWFEKKDLPECSAMSKAIRIYAYQRNVGDESLILSSFENPPNYESVGRSKMASRDGSLTGNSVDTTSLSDSCVLLQYEEHRNGDFVCPECRIIVNNIDLHCYPLIVGQMICFINRILSVSTNVWGNQDVSSKYDISATRCQVEKLGISGLRASGSSNEACILSNNFPFATVCNSGSIYSLEGSLIHHIPEWRKQAGLVDFLPRSTPKPSVMGNLSSNSARQMMMASVADYLPHVCIDRSSVKVKLSISHMNVHFHDSSCILGTLSLPSANSLFSINDDLPDIFISTVGMTFSSSLFASPIHDFLWGPVSPDLSPILNLSAKKDVGLEESPLRLCFSIQHVSCTLAPDFLCTIIGYFSLPDWNLNGTEQPVTGNLDDINPGNMIDIVYNVEILGSNLFTPAHSDGSQCLKLDIPQFYFSFIENGTKDVAVKEIPSDLLVMADKIADQSNCLNFFGRDLSLIFLLQKDGGFKASDVGEVSGQHFTLISQLSADVWVRIPSYLPSSCPTCIMAAVLNGQFIAEDECSIAGFNGLLDVINRFSIINEEFEFYTGDVLQFIQLKKSQVENPTCSQVMTSTTLTEIRSCVKSMSIRLHQPVKGSTTSEVLAHADMQFFCSASFVNDDPQLLDISFSSLALFSSLDSVKLAEASFLGSPVLGIPLAKLVRRENKFDIFLPSLQIWLHMHDWSRVIDAVKYYSEELSKPSGAQHLTNSLECYPNDLDRVSTIDVSLDSHDSPSVSCRSIPENIKKDTDLYLLDVDEAGITIHVPVLLNAHAFSMFSEYSVPSENDSDTGIPANQCGFVSFCMQTRCTGLIIDSQTLKLKMTVEKASASVDFYSDSNRRMRPLLQLSQIILEANVVNYQMADMSIKLEIRCDTLDGWITSHVIRLWSSLQFEVPEEGTSHLAFSMLELVLKLGKVTILLTDGKWSPGGPLLEIVFRNLILSSNITEEEMKGLVESDLQVNFNNVDKVMWEPFLEPWNFQLKLEQKHDKTALLNNARTMDILVQSESQFNLNVTESLIEVISRTLAMVDDSCRLMEIACLSKDRGFASYQMDKDQYTGSSAPYVIQNLTSLPLLFSVCKGQLHSDILDLSLLPPQDINALEPGSSFPIYINETPEEQLIRHLPSQSSDRLSEKHLLEAAHHYILIQLEGTSTPSAPISIDLVGHRYFEVNFSKSSSKSEVHNKDSARRDLKAESQVRDEGFVVPVVVDVSVEQYTKLIRLYSTVVLLNATPVPLEVRFDIPFGVSPKILDPVYPGQEFPLPLHLAEAGRIRCRPLGNTYLWSEAYSISSILSHENRIGFLRPIVCYPSHPSSDPFRCCILVNAKCLPSAGKLKKGFPVVNSHEKISCTRSSDHIRHDSDAFKPRYKYWMTLSSPLVLKNFLPEGVSIIIENGSVTRHASLSEVETSFSHVDSSHDLTITFNVRGFRSSVLKFPRGEIFSSTAKFDGTKYSLLETIKCDPESFSGCLYVTIEKIMDALSGAREVCISVPFLLYNCTGFPLVVLDSLNEMKFHGLTIPSSYNLDEQDTYTSRRNGLAVLSSNKDLHIAVANENPMASQKNHILERSTEITSVREPLSESSSLLQLNSVTQGSDSKEVLSSNSQEEYAANCQVGLVCTSFAESKEKRVDAFMYSPEVDCSPSEVMIRISRCLSGDVVNGPWSEPFPLVPPTGSINVLIPQPSSVQGHLVSVSSSAAPFSGKTRIISFQHRYVISNACNKAFSYKQKGTGIVLHLESGKHSSIEWSDTTRDLLVSVRFGEPGWQWSGCFLPDHLGDTQVKMRNFISGAVILIRIEVQSADLSFKEGKIVGRPTGNSGTHLILVSIDDTGFMPYRIDNFSKERLRVCQLRCESFETLVNAYTSCPYAWDEPCNPHRLTVEVPGERVVGSYALDDVKEFAPVYFPATLEKPERTLFISVHSEGAIKVLSIIDSTYHIKNDVKSNKLFFLKDKRNHDQKLEPYDHYKERITINVSFIGISLMNSFAEELLYACAKGVAVELTQSLEQQKSSLQISYLQIDNQLHNTPYPVILSFNSENKGQPASQIKMMDDPLKTSALDKLQEPVFYLAIAKWRNKETAPVSFEYISLRVADFHLDLEQDILLSMVDFARTISSRLQFRVLDSTESTSHPVYPSFVSVSGASAMTSTNTVASLRNKQYLNGTTSHDTKKWSTLFASVVPIGAPWQQIHILARQQKKIYVEQLDVAPINFSLSFSSSPWVLRNGVLTSGESLIHRGIMALADIEGAQIHLKHLTLSHQLASWESVQEILVRHYTRQFIHEMYKLFGSAGVLGNPIGFARSVGLGIKDFLSVPVRGLFQSPADLITGVAQGTTSLVSNTVYAVSDAATQFSKVAHKGIVAFTFDDQMVAKMDKQQKGIASQSKGLINGFFEGLTGMLQSPIRGAEKHGIPGVFSGVVLGVTGLVTRPAASILEVTGKTAQSIRNRSRSHHLASHRFRVRLPRALSTESALRAYSWEEAIGTYILAEADEGMKLRDETLVMCKTLKQGGRYSVITYKLILVVSCSSLVDLGRPTFRGIPAEPEWVIETDIQLDSVIHADCNGDVVHIVASSSDTFLRQHNNNLQKRIGGGGGGSRLNQWNCSQTVSPLFHTDIEFVYNDEAEKFLAVLLSTIEKAKEGGYGSAHLLHQSQLRQIFQERPHEL